MRLFIAINFKDEVKSNLLALRDELRSLSEAGNFSRPESLHLTLDFLGECSGKQVTDAKAAMDSVDFMPFDITVERLGRFKRNGGDIWWAGLAESKPLISLQRDLTSGLIASGFKLDMGRYSPHITLGREVVTQEKPHKIRPFTGTVHAIELMKSERINGKLTYTAIYKKTAATDMKKQRW